MSDWASDELIYLDITRDGSYDMRRDDLAHPNRENIVDIVRDVSSNCHMPITMGGRIRNLLDIQLRLTHGADKVCINTKALDDPSFIEKAAKEQINQAESRIVRLQPTIQTKGPNRN